jgi:hypothetical protein
MVAREGWRALCRDRRVRNDTLELGIDDMVPTFGADSRIVVDADIETSEKKIFTGRRAGIPAAMTGVFLVIECVEFGIAIRTRIRQFFGERIAAMIANFVEQSERKEKC